MNATASQPIRRQLRLLLLALGVPFMLFLGISTVAHACFDHEHAGQEMLALAHVSSARLDDHVGDITEVLAVLSEAVGVTAADEANDTALLTRLRPRLPPHINNVTVLSADGRVVASLDPRMRSTQVDLGNSSFFAKALVQSGVVVQAPTSSTLNGEPVAVFALRVMRAGQAVGVVAMGTRLRQLQAVLAPAGSVPDDAVVTVVGSDGVVLARSIDPDKWIGRNLLHQASGVAESLRLRDGVRDARSADGIMRIAGFTTARRLPWLVYVGLPESVAMAASRARLFENLALGSAMLLLGAFLSMLIGRRISAPLMELEGDARVLEAGDLSHRSKVQGRGEITVLSQTLNRMAETLQQRARLLESSEKQLADLYANAPCGYHSLDSAGVIVRINDTELEWLGRTREEVVGKTRITDFMTAEGCQLFADQFPRLQHEDRLDNLEFDLVGRPGEPIRVIANVSVLRDGQGKFEMTRTVLHDISELARTRMALRHLSQEQQAILDTDLVALLRLKDRYIVWCNHGAEQLFGYVEGGLIGRSMRLCYPDTDSYERVGAAARSILSSGKPFRDQLEMVTSEGKRIWIDLNATVLQTKPDETLCLIVDATQRHHAEEARLRGLALEMENRQLREASEFKDLFLANISHELRTPLNAVVGYTHLLRAELVKPGTSEYSMHLDRIGQGATQLQTMIGAMLDFAKADAESIELHPHVVDLAAVVQTVMENLSGPVREKDIAFAIQIDPSLAMPTIDELRFTQVLSAFVSNAIKFSRAGGHVEIRVNAESSTEFRVEVEDHGIGIPEADIPRVFTVFQQLSKAGTRAHAGAGIGLALARRLSEAQGGHVGVVSRLAFGSTFHVVLPMAPTSTV